MAKKEFRVTGLGMVLQVPAVKCLEIAKKLRDENVVLKAHYAGHVNPNQASSPAGYRVTTPNGRQIGWIVTSSTDEFETLAGVACELQINSCVMQSNGFPGLMIEIVESQNKPTPLKEKTEMKAPSLQDLVTANLNAATNAAKLELGAVANDRLAKIIGKRVPAPYKAVLGTPAGHLLLANAVMVAGKAIYPDNKNLGTVSNAMVVSSYQELIKQLDIPGILDELMGDKDIAKALAQEGATSE